MKLRCSRFSALVAGSACALCVGAAIAQGGVEPRAAAVRIYASGEIAIGRYDVVGRPWVDSWRTAFWAPTFPRPEQAIAALQIEGRTGARTGSSMSNASIRAPGTGRRAQTMRSCATGSRYASGRARDCRAWRDRCAGRHGRPQV